MILFLLFGMLSFILLGIPVGFAFLSTSVIYVMVSGDIPLVTIPQRMISGADHYVMLAIPFFFLAAEIMNQSGIMGRLIRFSTALVGHVRGGLAHMGVISNMLMAGISGSAVADAAGLGRLQIEMMKGAGYAPSFAAAISGAAATIGPIIPPSIPFVVYASVAGVSVGKLFLAGIVPGVLMGLFLMAASFVLSKRRSYPMQAWVGYRELGREFVRSVPVLVLPAIILGGILGGVFTPTEAAAVAALYAFLLAKFGYRSISWSELALAILKVGRDTARLLFIVATGSLYGWILSREGVPQEIASVFLSVSDQTWVILLLINALLLLLGCFLEPIVVLILVLPILAPLVESIGVDLIQFGVIVTINLMIGLITPPVGVIMFIMMGIADIKMESFLKEVWPFLLALFLVLAIVTFVPTVVLFIPDLYSG